MPKTDVLCDAPSRLRAPVARGLKVKAGEQPIAIDGGDYGAGLIRGFAVVTRGEALGHDMWIDDHFLQQVADAINASSAGVKSRFTHPGLSSDGMGKTLGRAKSAYVDGDVTRADMHFLAASHKSPDGDLGKYVMDLAGEDPAIFGTSIVFAHDQMAEAEFEIANSGDDGFESPDPANSNNFPHARLNELRAVDAVDDPAANPSGIFRRGQEVADEAWGYARFALGLTNSPPKVSEFDIDPTRIRAFVARFLEKEGLQIMPKETAMLNDAPAVEENKPAEGAAQESAQAAGEPVADPAKKPEDETAPGEGAAATGPAETQQSAKGGKDFLAAFGDRGGRWFAEGKTFDECQALNTKALQDENAELKKRLAQVKGGEVTAPAFSGADANSGSLIGNRLIQTLGERGARFAAGIQLPGRPSVN